MDDVLAAKDYWRDWVELAQPGPAPFPIAMSPHRPGLMPFFCLIHWVASKGGLITVDLSDMSFLSGARDLVLPRVAAGEVHVVGVRFFDRDEARIVLKPTRYNFAVEALLALAEEGRALLKGRPDGLPGEVIPSQAQFAE